MRGQILGVDLRTGEGMVAGDDGRRYAFAPGDWAHRGEPTVGAYVDFETADGRALSIFPMPAPAGAVAAVASPPPPQPRRNDRNKYVAAALAFFLGTLGIHRFYLGRTGSGITMLVLTCTLIGLIVTGLWALLDMIHYLVMPDDEFDHRYARPAR